MTSQAKLINNCKSPLTRHPASNLACISCNTSSHTGRDKSVEGIMLLIMDSSINPKFQKSYIARNPILILSESLIFL